MDVVLVLKLGESKENIAKDYKNKQKIHPGKTKGISQESEMVLVWVD